MFAVAVPVNVSITGTEKIRQEIIDLIGEIDYMCIYHAEQIKELGDNERESGKRYR